MDLRQLEYFVAVAEERSFTRGASRANVVQSAASAAISRLEREVGVALFERSGRHTELTDAGRLLLRRARYILGEVQQARDELDALAGGLHGSVLIGTVLSTGRFDLIAALAEFQRAYPNVSVGLQLSAGPLEDRVNELLDGRVQLMLIPIPTRRPPGVRLDHIADLRMALACPSDDSLVGRHQVTYRDIGERRFIDFPPDWGNRAIIDDLFATHDVRRHVALEVVDVSTALRMVRARLGIAFVPEEFVADVPGVVQVDLRDPPPAIRLGLGMALDRPVSVATRALRRTILARRRPLATVD
ncbi:MAG: LysR family transcriptional regulator [Pseudonocardiales bacterium]|nr:LysR family transcriptional regulator [Pseudonocardiales bacterium]